MYKHLQSCHISCDSGNPAIFMKPCKQKSVAPFLNGWDGGGALCYELGAARAVGALCDMGTATALPHGRVAAAKQSHPDSPAEIFIVFSVFCNEMGLRLENPY